MSCHFTYVTTHSPTLPSLYLHHSSFSNLSVASPTPQFILQPFFCFSYVTSSSLNSPGRAHSPTFPSFHLHHSSFYNTSVALPMSQLILQPFCCYTYITAHSPTLLSLLLCHRLFTQVTWRAAQGQMVEMVHCFNPSVGSVLLSNHQSHEKQKIF